MDQDQLDELLGHFVNDLGATISAGNVLLGDKLGLYRALAEAVRSRRVSWPPTPGPPNG